MIIGFNNQRLSGHSCQRLSSFHSPDFLFPKSLPNESNHRTTCGAIVQLLNNNYSPHLLKLGSHLPTSGFFVPWNHPKYQTRQAKKQQNPLIQPVPWVKIGVVAQSALGRMTLPCHVRKIGPHCGRASTIYRVYGTWKLQLCQSIYPSNVHFSLCPIIQFFLMNA